MMFHKNEQGSAIIQFLCAAPILIFLFFGIFQIGLMMYTSGSIEAEIQRASSEVDPAALSLAKDATPVEKNEFMRDTIINGSGAINPERLSVENTTIKFEKKSVNSILNKDVAGLHEISQDTNVAYISCDVTYALDTIIVMFNFDGQELHRHVEQTIVADRVIEVD